MASILLLLIWLSEHVMDTVHYCVITILTAVKVRTLRNVAIGSKNQLHILDNALETQREGGMEKAERDSDTHGFAIIIVIIKCKLYICLWLQTCGGLCSHHAALHLPDNNMIGWRSFIFICWAFLVICHCDREVSEGWDHWLYITKMDDMSRWVKLKTVWF